MIDTNLPIYLASKSPRRKKLLKQLGIKFKSISIDLNEEIFDGEHPIQTVKRIALHKFEHALLRVNKGILITADTIVVLNKKIIGKPKNKKDAFRILRMLSNKKHVVYTGYVVANLSNLKIIINYEKTFVSFNKLTDKEIKDYIDSGSPMDKAGAYGIQDDFGAVFVKRIDGCYYNVVGLPLPKLYKSLMEILWID
ncbi:MAG: septum formation protein Maf [Ignavibacteria bacterium]|nr:septum formation protein Maf [Ignavibacteria bacterium]